MCPICFPWTDLLMPRIGRLQKLWSRHVRCLISTFSGVNRASSSLMNASVMPDYVYHSHTPTTNDRGCYAKGLANQNVLLSALRESMRLISFQRDIQERHCIELEKVHEISELWRRGGGESMSSREPGSPLCCFRSPLLSQLMLVLTRPWQRPLNTCLLPHNHNPA